MKLEVGKYYKTRGGELVGPMIDTRLDDFPFNDRNGNWWTVNGYHEKVYDNSNIPEMDIIAEWQDTATPQDTPDLAAISKLHGICITVKVGGVVISYDGRE